VSRTPSQSPPPPGLVELVGELDRLWLDPEQATLPDIERILEERQRILGLTQNADTSALDPTTRAELSQRLRGIRDRDERLASFLDARREQAIRALDGLAHARQAVRGYAPSESELPRALNRVV